MTPSEVSALGIIPGMVEQPDVPESRLPFLRGDAHQPVQALLGQRGMRAEGHHEIELAGIVQKLDDHAEQLGQRQRAGVIGDQHQHPLPRELAARGPSREGLRTDRIVRQEHRPREIA